MARSGPKGTYSAPALEKAFEIIELLARRPDGAMISEIAADLGRSVGELFRLVIVLERLGYLRKSSQTDRYTVAYKLLELAFRATPAQDLVRAALPEMRTLSMATEQSCHFVVANGDRGMVIAREEQPGLRGFSMKVGAMVDMLRSCSGHVILAFSEHRSAEETIASARAQSDAPLDEAALQEIIHDIRSRGHELRQSPVTHGVTDISYPVFGFDGSVAGALTIPFLVLIDGTQKIDLEAARAMLAQAAARISDTLGHNAEHVAGS